MLALNSRWYKRSRAIAVLVHASVAIAHLAMSRADDLVLSPPDYDIWSASDMIHRRAFPEVRLRAVAGLLRRRARSGMPPFRSLQAMGFPEPLSGVRETLPIAIGWDAWVVFLFFFFI